VKLDPEKIRRLADRFDWAFEVEGGVVDQDTVATILYDVADGNDLESVADLLGLPCEAPSEVDEEDDIEGVEGDWVEKSPL
jgi:hypothetical protein